MVGLDLTLAIHNYILEYINADPTPSTTLQAKVDAGELGFKSGKGFLEWSDVAKSESRQHLANYLITSLLKDKNKRKEERIVKFDHWLPEKEK